MNMMGKLHTYKGNRISPSQLIMMIELAERPMYGYELIKEMREEYEGVWVPQTGSVYPALRRLQEHGLLMVENLDGKDHYSLSEEGRAWLDEILASLTSHVLFVARTMEVVPLDEEAPQHQLETLREIRETMLNHLRMLERQIVELETEVGD
jgi:DNA-binding PadR family transcriptional regulator